jgi:hypothetical protein
LFFTEIRVEADTLAAAVQGDDVETALQPLKAALDRLRSAKPEFDELLKLAQQTLPARTTPK